MQVFSQSAEYDKLKEDWEMKKKYLLDEFVDLKISDSDRVLAGKVRGLVSEFKATVEMEESIEKFFNKE